MVKEVSVITWLKVGFKVGVIGLINAIIFFPARLIAMVILGMASVSEPATALVLMLVTLAIFIPLALIVNGFLFWKFRKWIFA